MTSTQKFYLFLAGILSFSIAIISAYGGWSGLFRLIKPSGSDFTIAVWITGAVILVLFASGVKGYWDEGNPKATKGFAAGIATLSVLFFGVWFFFGEAALKRGQADLRQIGDNFTNRSAGGSGSSASNTRPTPCGPHLMVRKDKFTYNNPLQGTRPFGCTINFAKTEGMKAQIKYNNEEEWKNWFKDGVLPDPEKFIRAYIVRPYNPNEKLSVEVNFLEQRN